jgi:hypothetical protein
VGKTVDMICLDEGLAGTRHGDGDMVNIKVLDGAFPVLDENSAHEVPANLSRKRHNDFQSKIVGNMGERAEARRHKDRWKWLYRP